jgi:CRISPR-associated protein Cas1
VKNYYVLSNGRVRREKNTIYVENSDGVKKPIPIEDVESLYLYGEVDLNTRLLNFLSQKKITLHVFNYYGFYSGSFYPREYLHSGFLLVHQVGHYQDSGARLKIARELVRASVHSMLRNVSYYDRRKGASAEATEPPGEIDPSAGFHSTPDDEAVVDSAAVIDTLSDAEQSSAPWETAIDFDGEAPPLADLRATISGLGSLIDEQRQVSALMGIEGKVRERYYRCWPHILNSDWTFNRRVRRPPDNEINALISFGNSVLYTACLGEICRTQLTPTVSYLHEPGARRFSLALDLSEIFKPLIVDRAIFKLINNGELKETHFDRSMDGCYLTDSGKKIFLGALEERMNATIKHRRLGRHVSYRHLIRLECYKFIRHLTGVEPYRAFRAWW